MEQIRETPVGVLLLWIIALGLLALAIWQIAEAVVERNPDTKKKWGYRVKYIGTAASLHRHRVDGARLCPRRSVGLVAVVGDVQREAPGDARRRAPARSLVGLLVGGIGIAFIVRGITRGFEKHLDLPAGVREDGDRDLRRRRLHREGNRDRRHRSPLHRRRVHARPREGRADWMTHSTPSPRCPSAPIILWIVGAGLVIYGLFCFARARYAKM